MKQKQLEDIKMKRQSEKQDIKSRHKSLTYQAHLRNPTDMTNEEIRKMNELQQLKQKEQKDRFDKAENYSKYVREMYWPKASSKKHLELEALKSNMHHQSILKSADSLSRSPKRTPQSELPKKKPGEYEKPWRLMMSKSPLEGKAVTDSHHEQ